MLAKDSEKQVSMGLLSFPVKYLGRWMALNGCPELTEDHAVRLLTDQAFLENVMEDVFNFSADCLTDSRDAGEGIERYQADLERLKVPFEEDEFDDDEDDDYDSELDDSDSELDDSDSELDDKDDDEEDHDHGGSD